MCVKKNLTVVHIIQQSDKKLTGGKQESRRRKAVAAQFREGNYATEHS
jgi:hypothetical protein